MTKGEKLFWTVIIAMLLAVNPPILNLINEYSSNNTLTLGFPTFWLWLEFWYTLGAGAFLIAAFKIEKWREEENIQIEEGPFIGEEEKDE
ncbi:MAG: hypothetical protein ACOC21_03940 [Halanaerobiales bacterium]